MSELTPAEILARARQVYATCRSYQDQGLVVTRFVPIDAGGPKHSSRRPFWTAFVRPDRFRFEWAEAEVGPEEDWDRMLILWSVEGVRSSWTIQAGVRTHASVHDALSCATGVSGGSAYTVPSLLMPGTKGRDPLPSPEGVTHRGRESIEADACHVLEVAPRDGRTRTLWIGCDDSLIRRIDETQTFDEQFQEQQRRAVEERLQTSSDDQRKIIAEALEHMKRSPPAAFRTEQSTNYCSLLDEPIEAARFLPPASWSNA